MCKHVYLCMCVHVCSRVCVHVCARVCMCARVCTCVCMCTCVHVGHVCAQVCTCVHVFMCVHVGGHVCARASFLWFPGWLCVGVGGSVPPARLPGDRSAHLRALLPCVNELHAPAGHMPRVKRFGSAAGCQIHLSPSLPWGHFQPRSQSRSEAPAPSESEGGADSERHTFF